MQDREVRLLELCIGKIAVIKQIDGGHAFQRRLTSLGFRVGKIVCKVGSAPLKGPIVVEVDRVRIAIGRGIALKIIIEKLPA